ncbi:hypothetical protein H5410_025883 [Solanum commersonii]|uniref:Uncharacterized protein n=1 Tax=Solanum commersonii TaxID=4109 RepID=A0A9J5YXA8_SOLCO|nr:hypothetical protein H5410_025883 [Solanum commersonii]
MTEGYLKFSCHTPTAIVLDKPELDLPSITALLLQMDANLTHMRHHLDNNENTLSACSQKFSDIQAHPDLSDRRSLRGFRWRLWNLAQSDLGVGPTFIEAISNGNSPSPLSPEISFRLDSIYGLYFSDSSESGTSKFKFEGL